VPDLLRVPAPRSFLHRNLSLLLYMYLEKVSRSARIEHFNPREFFVLTFFSFAPPQSEGMPSSFLL